ncbi:MAG: hypothetical protein KF687_14360 [Cyclobacteriaceae bacterium]|nr:hypothetical protein [Cyclobacteriaceae bacterium]
MWVIAKKSYGQQTMRLTILTFILIVTLDSCSSNYNSEKFDKTVWLSNNDMADRYNPRAQMTNDLLENYLKPGIHRDSIILLLGRPYLEKIENRLPKGLQVPDSLSLIDSVNFRKENRDKALKNYNDWYAAHGRPDTLMFYPVGWSTIDPKFLVIKFKSDSTAYEFWVEQH